MMGMLQSLLKIGGNRIDYGRVLSAVSEASFIANFFHHRFHTDLFVRIPHSFAGLVDSHSRSYPERSWYQGFRVWQLQRRPARCQTTRTFTEGSLTCRKSPLVAALRNRYGFFSQYVSFYFCK